MSQQGACQKLFIYVASARKKFILRCESWGWFYNGQFEVEGVASVLRSVGLRRESGQWSDLISHTSALRHIIADVFMQIQKSCDFTSRYGQACHSYFGKNLIFSPFFSPFKRKMHSCGLGMSTCRFLKIQMSWFCAVNCHKSYEFAQIIKLSY